MRRFPVLAIAAALAAALGVVFVVVLVALVSERTASTASWDDPSESQATASPAEPFGTSGGAPVPGGPPPPASDRATPRNFRVAFLGDEGNERRSLDVLNLVKSEGAGMLMILGDFDYEDNPDDWDAMLTLQLGWCSGVCARESTGTGEAATRK